MHIVFIEPRFPGNQKLFVKALAEIGATVTAIGEGGKDSLDSELKHWLTHYEEVGSVCDEEAVLRALRFVQGRKHVDRIEATIEAHIMPTARVREAAGIPGTSVRTAYLCRDKPAMKEVLDRGLDDERGPRIRRGGRLPADPEAARRRWCLGRDARR